jgi:hypothetical protein
VDDRPGAAGSPRCTVAAAPGARSRTRSGAGGRLSDLLVRQGAPGGSEVVAPWRPAAAGIVIAAGGDLVVVLGLVGVELIDILLVLGLTMLVAGFVDGTGRRYRGAGIGLTTVGIIPRFFGDAPWLQEGWAFGIFLIAYGSYVALRRRQERTSA